MVRFESVYKDAQRKIHIIAGSGCSLCQEDSDIFLYVAAINSSGLIYIAYMANLFISEAARVAELYCIYIRMKFLASFLARN